MGKDIQKLSEYGEKKLREHLNIDIKGIEICLDRYKESPKGRYIEMLKENYKQTMLQGIREYKELRKFAEECGLNIEELDRRFLDLLPKINEIVSIPIAIEEIVGGSRV